MSCSKQCVGKTFGVCRQRRNTFGIEITLYSELFGKAVPPAEVVFWERTVLIAHD